jgi:hypothetical protein
MLIAQMTPNQMGDDATRPLTASEQTYVEAAKQKAFILYEGVIVPHRSCGIAIAETFGLPSRSYQALRRGGISGQGDCGAIRAGEQVLGELLGDPDPCGAVTGRLRAAIIWYQQQWKLIESVTNAPDIVCNNLVRPLGQFSSPERSRFCTNLAAQVAALTAEALVRFVADERHDMSDCRPAITPVVPTSKSR